MKYSLTNADSGSQIEISREKFRFTIMINFNLINDYDTFDEILNFFINGSKESRKDPTIEIGTLEISLGGNCDLIFATTDYSFIHTIPNNPKTRELISFLRDNFYYSFKQSTFKPASFETEVV